MEALPTNHVFLVCNLAKVRTRVKKTTVATTAPALITAKLHIFHFYTGPTSPNTTPNMSKKASKEDEMLGLAVTLYNSSGIMTVSQSLLGAEFTKDQADAQERQMMVNRRANKRNTTPPSNNSTATSPTTVQVASPASAVSSIIVLPSPVKFPPPKLTQIQGTTKGYNAQNKQQSTKWNEFAEGMYGVRMA
jgi:predicted extracellular nuclease